MLALCLLVIAAALLYLAYTRLLLPRRMRPLAQPDAEPAHERASDLFDMYKMGAPTASTGGYQRY